MAKGEKKSAKVSIKEWEKATKENFPSVVTEQWFDIPVTIKYSISFTDMLEFVEGAVASCFNDGYGFVPEVMDFAICSNILKYYTNVTLPEDLGKRYDLIYNSNLVAFVTEFICQKQLSDIIKSVDRKVKHLSDSNAKIIEEEATRLLDAFDRLQAFAGDMFSNINVDDVRNLVHALSEYGTLDEKKIVEALMDNRNEAEETAK